MDPFLDHDMFSEAEDEDGSLPSDTDSEEDVPFVAVRETQTSEGHTDQFVKSKIHPQTGVFSTFNDAATRQERIRRNNILQHFNACTAEVEAATELTQHLNLQLEACRRNMDSLQGQLQDAQGREVAALEVQLEGLEAREEELAAELDEASMALADAQETQEQFSSLRDEVLEAEKRDAKEDAILRNLRRTQETREASRHIARQRKEAAMNEELSHYLAVSNAEAEQKAYSVLAKTGSRAGATLKKQRSVEATAKRAAEQEHEKRVGALMSLKRNTAEVAKRDKKNAVAREKRRRARQQKEEQERKEILARGGNPEAVFLQRRLEAEALAKRNKEVAAKQEHERRIVEKLMREREQKANERIAVQRKSTMKRSKPPKPTSLPKHRSEQAATSSDPRVERTMELTKDNFEELEPEIHGWSDKAQSDLLEADDVPRLSDSEYETDDDDDDATRWDAAEEFAEPDIQGAWGSDWAPEAPKASAQTLNKASGKSTLQTRALSTFEQRTLTRKLEDQKNNIFTTQVVSGREFKGIAFSCKPSQVVFEDFEVGRTYKQRLVLTNVSYGLNSFKLTPTPHDTIELVYNPSGPLSPGLSTDLTVIFAPRRSLDLDLSLTLLAQTGPFSIPIRCTVKKCLPSLSVTSLCFNRIRLGEKARCHLTLRNDGALPSSYSVQPKSHPAGEVSDQAETGEAEEDFSASPITIVKGAEGTLAPRSSRRIELLFAPEEPCSVEEVFMVLFGEEGATPISFSVRGDCDDIAVYMATPTIDMQICQYGQTYACDVLVKSRNPSSSAAVRLEVPKPLRPFVEFTPRSGMIQGNGSFKSSVLLTPLHDLFAILGDKGDPETGLIEFTCKLAVDKQVLSDTVTIKAHITPSDMELSTTQLEFGTVAVDESAIASITIINKSALPQQFAFCELPRYIIVEPDDGFGTILPFETLEYDVILSPIAKPFDDSDRKLKSIIKFCYGGKTVPITCTATATCPPCSISTSCVKFPATAAGDTSSSVFTVTNNRSEAMRFEFIPQDGLPVVFSPSSGLLLAESSCPVRITFQPPSIEVPAAVEDSTISEQERLIAAYQAFKPTYTVEDIPCYLQARDLPADAEPYQDRDTQRLHVELPCVAPVMVVKDAGQASSNRIVFPSLAIGSSDTVSVTLQNVSEFPLELSSSTLDTSGPFRIVNALREIPANGSFVLKLAFEPRSADDYLETLRIRNQFMSVKLQLQGTGVLPSLVVKCAPELFVGDCLVQQVVRKTFKLENTSPFALDVKVLLASAQPNQPTAVRTARDKDTGAPLVERIGTHGTRNFNGTPSFSIDPEAMTIEPGTEVDVVAVFAPEHQSQHYFDTVYFKITEDVQGTPLLLRARAWSQLAFISGLDESEAPVCHDILSAATTNISSDTTSGVLTLKYHHGQEELRKSFDLGVAAGTGSQDKKKAPGGDFALQWIGDNSTFELSTSKVTVSGGDHSRVDVLFKPKDPEALVVGSVISSNLAVTGKVDGNAVNFEVRVIAHVLA